LGVTAKNFFLSFVDRDRLPTVQYPEEGDTVMAFTRNIPFLVYDGENPVDGMRCTACLACEKACPPQCIHIERDTDENGKPLKRPRVFDIDASICMSCQLCVEACPFEAIRMDSEFELSVTERFDELLYDRARLLKSNDYYHSIHPQEARETDERIAAKARAKEARKTGSDS
jgi:NADH-quinone oxidoreductase subunit I